jgi:hypothetical protein
MGHGFCEPVSSVTLDMRRERWTRLPCFLTFLTNIARYGLGIIQGPFPRRCPGLEAAATE